VSKHLGVLASCIVVIFLLCACGRSDSRTVIQFASWGSKSEVDIIRPILAEFEVQNPDIKVDFMHIPQNYFQKIHLLFASNTAPDVIFINNLYLPVYANAGLLMPLAAADAGEQGVRSKELGVRDEINGTNGKLSSTLQPFNLSTIQSSNRSTFQPKALEALSWNGKLYAIPRDVSNMVIYYNKSIFDGNNVPYPHDGWTLEEFLQTAKKLTHRPDVYGISFEEEPLYWMPFAMSQGVLDAEMLRGEDADLTSNLASNLDFYSDLRKKHHVAPMRNESASATMAQMFLQGRLAMHLSGRWLVPKYREDAKFDWDVVTFPRGSAGSVVPLDASGWAIANSSKHPQEAQKLIEFLASKTSIEKFAASGLIVPARTDAASAILDGKTPCNAQAFLKTITTSKPTPVTVNYKEETDKLREKLEYKFN
jgi:multiple sugar transport system substrate-binding protein